VKAAIGRITVHRAPTITLAAYRPRNDPDLSSTRRHPGGLDPERSSALPRSGQIGPPRAPPGTQMRQGQPGRPRTAATGDLDGKPPDQIRLRLGDIAAMVVALAYRQAPGPRFVLHLLTFVELMVAGERAPPRVGSGAGEVMMSDGRAQGLSSAGFPVGCATPGDLGQVIPFPAPSCSRHFEPGVRFSRARLTDAVHRRHAVYSAKTCSPWAGRRLQTC
jgi:hypothetical protein